MREREIVYEARRHWVRRLPNGTFEVYRKELTHSVRCATIGFTGDKGLSRAINECERRETA